MRPWTICILAITILPPVLHSSETDTTATDIAPKVFLDSYYAHMDFIRKEIPYVNYVIDRKEADIHIMITRQSTGSGGDEYTITCFGQRRFQAKNDTLSFSTRHDATEDMIRNKMVRYLKIGLMTYLARTPIAQRDPG